MEEPERLTVFAVRAPDGTIVEGRSAYDAMMRASRAGFNHSYRDGGFITSLGRFVPEGREATMIAFHADQLRRNTTLYKTLSQGAIPFDVRDYGTESSVRGVGGKNATVGPAPEPLIAARITESGVERGPDTNPWHEVYLREQERKAGLPEDRNNPEGKPLIVSRAIRYNYGAGEGAQVSAIDHFYAGGRYLHPETRKPLHVVEGYTLSDGSFITRDEAKERFGGADIAPDRRRARGRKNGPPDPEGPKAA